MRRRDVLIGGSAALFSGPFAFAQPSLRRFEYGTAGIDPGYCAAYVAFRQGYFRDAGLEVTNLNSLSGPRTKQMLVAGQILVGSSGVNDPLTVTIAGKPTSVILGFDRRIAFANMLVHKDSYESGRIRRLQDLAGQRVAVTQPQSATWLMGVYMLDRAGVHNADIRGLGDVTTMLGALKAKQVAATVANIGMVLQARDEGWGVPVFSITDDASWQETFGGDVPGLGCYVMTESITRHPETIQAFVDAVVKAQDFITANTTATLVDLLHADYLSPYPRETLRSAIDIYRHQVWSNDNIITEAAYNRLLDIAGHGRQFSDAEVARLPYAQAVNMDFVKRARHL